MVCDMSRPKSLFEVSERVRSGEMTFGTAVREYLDSFYGFGTGDRIYSMASSPEQIGQVEDAYLAAVAEHLSLQYDLPVPEWSETVGFDLERPWFGTKLESIKPVLLAESPLAFRRRMLFVSENALHRASMNASRSGDPPKNMTRAG